MIPDILSIIPLLINIGDASQNIIIRFICCIFFLRYFSISHYWKYFEQRFILYGTRALIYKLFHMLLLIIILCHWVSCTYHYLAIIEIDLLDYSETWLHKIDLWEAPWYIKYVEGFYWAIATFLLVGSKGDTVVETVYCIIMLIITVFLFAYILSTIQQIL